MNMLEAAGGTPRMGISPTKGMSPTKGKTPLSSSNSSLQLMVPAQ
jgi:hypothetical protein